MRDLTELNINTGGKPVGRAPPSPDVVAAFERRFGVMLPEGLLRLLRFANGGHPELDTFQPVGRSDLAPCAVDHFLHLDEDRDCTSSAWRNTEVWRGVLGDRFLPFAEDGGGNPFLLDLSDVPPSVCRCLHDEDCAVVQIAPSLEVFLDGLHLDPDMI